MELYEWNYTDARLAIVGHTKDFHDTVMCGDCSKPGKDEVESGLMSLACYVELSEAESGGSGMPRTTSGPKSILRCKNDGSMSTLARSLGIIHDYMLKDGERRCLTA
jgi:hypothetical protein